MTKHKDIGMRYYDNGIYPVALVVSHDVASIDKEYYNAVDGPNEHISVKPTAEATTMFLTRRTDDYYAMAVGIVFNKEATPRLVAHEAFHATRMMLEIGCHIFLDDSSEEAWAYLHGWVVKCIDEYLKERDEK